MDSTPKRAFRLIVDFKSQFPEKLYDVANDGHLIHWNINGSISVTNEEEFEQNVMRWYPGFLQIPSFLNFKRLFREYGFDRVVNDKNVYEFSHPCFIRGRRDLTRKILTRRKSMRYPANFKRDEPLLIETEEGKRYSTRKRKRTTRFNHEEDNSQHSDTDIEGQGDIGKTYIISHTDMKKYPVAKPAVVYNDNSTNPLQNSTTSVQKPQEATYVDKKQLQDMMENYAEKEFTEDEYEEWLSKQRKKDNIKKDGAEEVNKDTTKSKEFWWMYEEKQGTNVTEDTREKLVSTARMSTDNCMPCGFCKCCSAISNYVHIFGEIPENIQVFDYLVEVPAGTEVAEDSADDLDVVSEVIIETQ